MKEHSVLTGADRETIIIVFQPNSKTAVLPDDYFREICPQRFMRACRYRHSEDRLMCLGAGLLIHRVLGVREDEILKNSFGKPYISDGRHFSISHSGGYAAIAVYDLPVGIDIETIGKPDAAVAKCVFSAGEREWISHDPDTRFYNLWTIKESILKAIGTGLSTDPLSVRVIPSDSENTAIVSGEKYSYAYTMWNGLAIAAAVKGESGLRCHSVRIQRGTLT